MPTVSGATVWSGTTGATSSSVSIATDPDTNSILFSASALAVDGSALSEEIGRKRCYFNKNL